MSKIIPESGHAPADQRPRARRSLGATVVVYLLLAGLALASIWYIDRAVMSGEDAEEQIRSTKPE